MCGAFPRLSSFFSPYLDRITAYTHKRKLYCPPYLPNLYLFIRGIHPDHFLRMSNFFSLYSDQITINTHKLKLYCHPYLPYLYLFICGIQQ